MDAFVVPEGENPRRRREREGDDAEGFHRRTCSHGRRQDGVLLIGLRTAQKLPGIMRGVLWKGIADSFYCLRLLLASQPASTSDRPNAISGSSEGSGTLWVESPHVLRFGVKPDVPLLTIHTLQV